MLLALLQAGTFFALQPEGEPIEIPFIDLQPMTRLVPNMQFVRADIEL
jgi:hypothetical protein